MIKNLFGFLKDNFFYRKFFFIIFTSLSLMFLCSIEIGGYPYSLIFIFALLLSFIVSSIISDTNENNNLSYNRRIFPALLVHLINLSLYVNLQILYPSVLKDWIFSSNERITSLSNEELEFAHNKIQNGMYPSMGTFGIPLMMKSVTNNIKNEYNTRKEKESQ